MPLAASADKGIKSLHRQGELHPDIIALVLDFHVFDNGGKHRFWALPPSGTLRHLRDHHLQEAAELGCFFLSSVIANRTSPVDAFAFTITVACLRFLA